MPPFKGVNLRRKQIWKASPRSRVKGRLEDVNLSIPQSSRPRTLPTTSRFWKENPVKPLGKETQRSKATEIKQGHKSRGRFTQEVKNRDRSREGRNTEKEVVMKETQGSASDTKEESDPDMNQDMDLEEISVDLSALRETHGAQKINNLTISQLRKLQRDLVKGKGVGSSQGWEQQCRGTWESRLTPLRPRRISQERRKRKGGNHIDKK
jgi:hypothetical protein